MIPAKHGVRTAGTVAVLPRMERIARASSVTLDALLVPPLVLSDVPSPCVWCVLEDAGLLDSCAAGPTVVLGVFPAPIATEDG